MRPQMYSVGATRDGNIGSRVDEEARFKRRVLANHPDGSVGEIFQFAAGQILFPQLDEVHASPRRFCDLIQ